MPDIGHKRHITDDYNQSISKNLVISDRDEQKKTHPY